jgi:CubicO group peptidase (beta-lactamase class C family)
LPNYEDDARITSDTKLRIGSITNQFTAFAMMVPQERGKLSISEGVCKYMQSCQPCPEAWQPVTIRHLLTGTSGPPNYTTFPDIVCLKLMRHDPAVPLNEINAHALDFTRQEGRLQQRFAT